MASTDRSEIQKGVFSKHKQAPNAMSAGDGPDSYIRNSSYQVGRNRRYCKANHQRHNRHKSRRNFNQLEHPNLHCRFRLLDRRQLASYHASHRSGNQTKTRILVIIDSRILRVPQRRYSNDFNTLFGSLPLDRLYHAVGVPGDFHGRLLPRSSLHFVHSSWSLHWLTEVPRAVADRDSPAWNGGRALYTRERKEVCDAYLDQYSRDLNSFLEARAVEMVAGGLMALIVPGEPEFLNPETEYTIHTHLDVLGSCLMDMAKKGIFSEAKVDSFNFPFYFTTLQQMNVILESSQSFSIETMEILNNPGMHTFSDPDTCAAGFRAITGSLLTNHFGRELIMDELFQLFTKKLTVLPFFENTDNDKTIVVLAVLKRKMEY
ncbi:hypothetical protein CASFOL_024365 [Castilleja foliolosa]|uniref:S-adenosylmethionine-dependent methyltransferase n=1 Tax=Castilleja foliolosa TaxID=1961234 RepID=A0ABD3CPW8_9LAMI